MAILDEIITIIRELPSGHFEKIPMMIPEIARAVPKGKNFKEFIIEAIQKGDKTAIEAIYNPLSLFLAAGGSFGGPVGIAFNAVDAAFCIMLSNTLGLVIDVLAIVLVFPGAKAGLTGISQSVKVLPKLISKYFSTGLALKAIKKVLARAKSAGKFTEEMCADLYFICKPYLRNTEEVLNYLFSYHKKAFEIIEQRLRKSIGYDKTIVGEGYTKTPTKLKYSRGIKESFNYQKYIVGTNTGKHYPYGHLN